MELEETVPKLPQVYVPLLIEHLSQVGDCSHYMACGTALLRERISGSVALTPVARARVLTYRRTRIQRRPTRIQRRPTRLQPGV